MTTGSQRQFLADVVIDLWLKLGVPSRREFRRVVDDFQPDLVILREKSLYSIVCWSILKRRNISALLYNQSPLWEKPELVHNDFPHRLMLRLLQNRGELLRMGKNAYRHVSEHYVFAQYREALGEIPGYARFGGS